MSARYGPVFGIANAYGNTGLGVLGSSVPSTGTAGPSFLYNDLSLPADNNVEVRAFIASPPTAGTFFAFEDGGFTFIGAADGTYTFLYRLYGNGVDLGTALVTMNIGATTPIPIIVNSVRNLLFSELLRGVT